MKAAGALGSWLRSIKPDRKALPRDAIAGASGAVAAVPDGMASALLAGVNPIHGLYATFAGPIGGGLTTSTRLMVITTTSAGALAAGSALSALPAEDRTEGLFVLTALAGIVMIAAGILRLGRYTRFVSLSVMIGFLTGIAANIIFGQIPNLTGAPSEGRFALEKALNVITNPSEIDTASLLCGVGALAIAFGLGRTRIGAYAAIVALIVPTLLVLNVDGIDRVEDVGAIPGGLPMPHVPDFSLFLSFSVWTGALAVAAIVLVQGAGVAEAAPNADGSRSRMNRDFVAQGVGNVASGLFRGQPVGGSVGSTALNIASGAVTRWASIFAGISMLAILVLFSGQVGKVAMPTLAALLIYAAIGSLRVGEIRTILRTGPTSQIGFTTTFLATLFLPVAAAVGIGVALSLLLQLNREALDLSVVELVRRPGGRFAEQPAPKRLPSRSVTVLDVYGSLYYAGAKTLEAQLPDPAGSESPVVVLRLRGRTALGATGFSVLAGYARRLGAVGGRLYLSGVDPGLMQLAQRNRQLDVTGPVRAFEATELIGESTEQAVLDAEAWLIGDES